MDYRIEKDSLGEIKVENTKAWGAQTQRCLENFNIGNEKMPEEQIIAMLWVKRVAAAANFKFDKVSKEQWQAIDHACEYLLNKENIREDFPLPVWQTGSGTQTNMNCNEVIAHFANAYNKEQKIDAYVHPNDHVNASQSTNDVFPTAMHMACVRASKKKLIPSIQEWIQTLDQLIDKYGSIIKTGRTHLQDATPITFGQEMRGWKGLLEESLDCIQKAEEKLYALPIGGTAVGNGLNAPKEFGSEVVSGLNEALQEPFTLENNHFQSMSGKVALSFYHGGLRTLATALIKIANDIRYLASGPRCGYGEIIIPANEPGSSIMPGKINPTQCEAMTMICAQVLGNDATVSFAASQGAFQLNVYMPVIVFNVLQSINILSAGMEAFNSHCLQGLKPNEEKMEENLNKSLMLVTALNKYIGYENSARIAKHAYANQLSLKESALELKILSEEDFDKYLKPEDMV